MMTDTLYGIGQFVGAGNSLVDGALKASINGL